MIICEKKKRFYVYIFVDLAKCDVLTHVDEIWHYRLLEMTIINLIIIKTLATPTLLNLIDVIVNVMGAGGGGGRGSGAEIVPANRQKCFTVGVVLVQ